MVLVLDRVRYLLEEVVVEDDLVLTEHAPLIFYLMRAFLDLFAGDRKSKNFPKVLICEGSCSEDTCEDTTRTIVSRSASTANRSVSHLQSL